MDAQTIKEYIFSNNKIEIVLENLGMHHIQWHNRNEYITCGMPDGDNPSSTVVYCDNSFFMVKAYTRDIVDPYGISDIISLVSFINKTIFTQSINWLCELFGLDYYVESISDDPTLGYFKTFDLLMKPKASLEVQLKPIPEETLKAYLPWDNTIFYEDHIDWETQAEFELGLDVFSHRITIPIRDEMGRLVGVKGRRAWDAVDEWNPKYIYLHQCAKSRICYGLYKTLPYIREKNEIIVCESEKGVMQLWSYGYRNCVAVGGHSISQQQQDLIIQSGAATIIIAFDKDVDEETVRKEVENLSLYRRVEYILDFNNILEEKESPMDNPNKWIDLYERNRKLYINKR
jgi:DNA primase